MPGMYRTGRIFRTPISTHSSRPECNGNPRPVYGAGIESPVMAQIMPRYISCLCADAQGWRKGPALPDVLSNDPEHAARMPEKGPVSGTQIIQARTAMRSYSETVNGASPVTHRQERAFSAASRQGIFLVMADLAIFFRFEEILQGRDEDIPQMPGGLHITDA